MSQCKKTYDFDNILVDEVWSNKGLFHRADGPAYISYFKNGKVNIEAWYINGIYHRENGPVYIAYNEDRSVYHEVWRINNLLHREYGPAVICNRSINPWEEWHINGNEITNEVNEWIVKYNIPHWTKWTNKEKAMFKLKFVR